MPVSIFLIKAFADIPSITSSSLKMYLDRCNSTASSISVLAFISPSNTFP